jgi:hypothetical protein
VLLPGRLSTMVGPSVVARYCANTRATVSGCPPTANGTMILITLLG